MNDKFGRGRSGAPCPVVYLHVGAPKTGTTFLQQVLWRNRRVLAGEGVSYPAEATGDHFRAALDLRGVRFRGHDDPAVAGSWQRVVDAVRRWRDSTVVISHEVFAAANEEQARAAVESLDPAEVHIVYTARDLARQLPAMWQEDVKNGGVADFGRYLRAVQAPENRRLGRPFWRAQDAVSVLGRWGAAVPANRIHVVTVPPAGAAGDLLWRRFAGLVGVDADRCDMDVAGSNVSLGRAEVELLRRVNRALDRRLEWPQYEALVKRWLAETVLAAQPRAGRIVLPPSWHAWAVERSQRLVAGLRDAGYDVVGDLDELLPRPVTAGNAASGDDAATETDLDATAHGIACLLDRVTRTPADDWPRPGRVRQLEEELARRRCQPFKTLVRDVSEPIRRSCGHGWRGGRAPN